MQPQNRQQQQLPDLRHQPRQNISRMMPPPYPWAEGQPFYTGNNGPGHFQGHQAPGYFHPYWQQTTMPPPLQQPNNKRTSPDLMQNQPIQSSIPPHLQQPTISHTSPGLMQPPHHQQPTARHKNPTSMQNHPIQTPYQQQTNGQHMPFTHPMFNPFLPNNLNQHQPINFSKSSNQPKPAHNQQPGNSQPPSLKFFGTPSGRQTAAPNHSSKIQPQPKLPTQPFQPPASNTNMARGQQQIRAGLTHENLPPTQTDKQTQNRNMFHGQQFPYLEQYNGNPNTTRVQNPPNINPMYQQPLGHNSNSAGSQEAPSRIPHDKQGFSMTPEFIKDLIGLNDPPVTIAQQGTPMSHIQNILNEPPVTTQDLHDTQRPPNDLPPQNPKVPIEVLLRDPKVQQYAKERFQEIIRKRKISEVETDTHQEPSRIKTAFTVHTDQQEPDDRAMVYRWYTEPENEQNTESVGPTNLEGVALRAGMSVGAISGHMSPAEPPIVNNPTWIPPRLEYTIKPEPINSYEIDTNSHQDPVNGNKEVSVSGANITVTPEMVNENNTNKSKGKERVPSGGKGRNSDEAPIQMGPKNQNTTAPSTARGLLGKLLEADTNKPRTEEGILPTLLGSHPGDRNSTSTNKDESNPTMTKGREQSINGSSPVPTEQKKTDGTTSLTIGDYGALGGECVQIVEHGRGTGRGRGRGRGRGAPVKRGSIRGASIRGGTVRGASITGGSVRGGTVRGTSARGTLGRGTSARGKPLNKFGKQGTGRGIAKRGRGGRPRGSTKEPNINTALDMFLTQNADVEELEKYLENYSEADLDKNSISLKSLMFVLNKLKKKAPSPEEKSTEPCPSTSHNVEMEDTSMDQVDVNREKDCPSMESDKTVPMDNSMAAKSPLKKKETNKNQEEVKVKVEQVEETKSLVVKLPRLSLKDLKGKDKITLKAPKAVGKSCASDMEASPAKASVTDKEPSPAKPLTSKREPSSTPSITRKESSPTKPSTSKNQHSPNKPSTSKKQHSPNKPLISIKEPSPTKPSTSKKEPSPTKPSTSKKEPSPSKASSRVERKPSDANKPDNVSSPKEKDSQKERKSVVEDEAEKSTVSKDKGGRRIYIIDATHKYNEVLFHNIKVLQLITVEGNFFLMIELLKRCFVREISDKAERLSERQRILIMKEKVLEIPFKAMDSTFHHIVETYLRNKNVRKKLHVKTSVISEEDALRLFHFYFNDSQCSNGCIIYNLPKKSTKMRRTATSTSTNNTPDIPQTVSKQSDVSKNGKSVCPKHKQQDSITDKDSVIKVKEESGTKKKDRNIFHWLGRETMTSSDVIDLTNEDDEKGNESDVTLPYEDEDSMDGFRKGSSSIKIEQKKSPIKSLLKQVSNTNLKSACKIVVENVSSEMLVPEVHQESVGDEVHQDSDVDCKMVVGSPDNEVDDDDVIEIELLSDFEDDSSENCYAVSYLKKSETPRLLRAQTPTVKQELIEKSDMPAPKKHNSNSTTVCAVAENVPGSKKSYDTFVQGKTVIGKVVENQMITKECSKLLNKVRTAFDENEPSMKNVDETSETAMIVDSVCNMDNSLTASNKDLVAAASPNTADCGKPHQSLINKENKTSDIDTDPGKQNKSQLSESNNEKSNSVGDTEIQPLKDCLEYLESFPAENVKGSDQKSGNRSANGNDTHTKKTVTGAKTSPIQHTVEHDNHSNDENDPQKENIDKASKGARNKTKDSDKKNEIAYLDDVVIAKKNEFVLKTDKKLQDCINKANLIQENGKRKDRLTEIYRDLDEISKPVFKWSMTFLKSYKKNANSDEWMMRDTELEQAYAELENNRLVV